MPVLAGVSKGDQSRWSSSGWICVYDICLISPHSFPLPDANETADASLIDMRLAAELVHNPITLMLAERPVLASKLAHRVC